MMVDLQRGDSSVRPLPSVVRVVTVTLVPLLLSMILIRSCGQAGWGPGAPHPYCYTDIKPLYEKRGFARHAIPYLEAENEYPVLTGFFAYAASIPVRSPSGFFAMNVILLGACAIGVSLALRQTVGRRFAYFALAPSLVLYAFLNWDLLAVLLATVGTYAFLRKRDGCSGVLLGLGAAAKLYPGLLVLPFVADRVRDGDRRGGLQLLGMATLTWIAVNAPVAFASFRGWSVFYRVSAERPPTWGTLWSVGCRALWGTEWCPHRGWINVIWPLTFGLVMAVIWWRTSRRAPGFPRWTLGLPLLAALLLTSKVYSPQFSLWLVPWFALVLPLTPTFIFFEAADFLVFVTEFSAQGARFGLDPFPRWSLDVAVVVRALALGAILAQFVRRPPNGSTSNPLFRITTAA